MNFISCHIQNSLLLCGGSESGKRNSLSSFGSWSEWAQEWLEIHSSAIRLQWHKLAARRAQILPDTDGLTRIVHCRGALTLPSAGKHTGRHLLYGTSLMSSGTHQNTRNILEDDEEKFQKTKLNMGNLEGHGRQNAEYRGFLEERWSQSWNHGATQPRWPAEALRGHSRLAPSGHGRHAEVHPSHQSGSYQSLGWRNMMQWDQKTLQTLKISRNNMHLKAPHSFLLHRIELQFLSEQCWVLPNIVFRAWIKHPCLLRLAADDANVTIKN